MNKKLDIHITDTVEGIDLKIYEQKICNTTMFTFNIEDSRDGQKVSFTTEEKIAAILFEGLNNIFVEDDTEYQTDQDVETNNIEDLNNFFKIIEKNDVKFFG